MAQVYDFRPGHSIKNVNAQDVGDELERLRAEKGVLTPADVLEAASDKDSPMHNAFEWDDTEAARRFRLQQARKLIVSIRVINSPVQARVPAYVSVRDPEKGRSYVPTVEALTNEDIKARVLMEISQFVESMQRRYAHFQEAADVIARMKASVA